MMLAGMVMLALAVQSPAACAKDGVAAIAGWADAQSMASGGALPLGRSVSLSLRPTTDVRFPRVPERAPAAGTRAGILSVTIVAAGRYRVMLNAPAWIDLVAGDRAIASAAHGHGAPCSGVRKMVDFDLKPGTYTLQVSGAATPALRVMLIRS